MAGFIPAIDVFSDIDIKDACPPGYAEQLAPGPSWLFPAFACVPV
jgi:hypothetical protein